jgi:UDP-2,3-diacylglucosamine pyrophosphatase LpxH
MSLKPAFEGLQTSFCTKTRCYYKVGRKDHFLSELKLSNDLTKVEKSERACLKKILNANWNYYKKFEN